MEGALGILQGDVANVYSPPGGGAEELTPLEGAGAPHFWPDFRDPWCGRLKPSPTSHKPEGLQQSEWLSMLTEAWHSAECSSSKFSELELQLSDASPPASPASKFNESGTCTCTV